MVKLTTDYQLDMADVTGLTTDSSDRVHQFSYTPDYYYVVAQLTAGAILVYPSGSPGDRLFIRLKTGLVRFPTNTDKVAVRSVAASGTYTVYAVKGTMLFKVKNFTA